MNNIKKYIPNSLSIMRIFASFVAIYFFYMKDALAVYILAWILGISDCADGYLARLWKVESKIGAALDPIGDKLACNIYLIGLYIVWGKGNLFLIGLSLLRDVALVVGGTYMIMRGYMERPLPSIIGKLTTLSFAMYFLAQLFVILRWGNPAITELCADTFTVLLGLLLACSFYRYVKYGIEQRRNA